MMSIISAWQNILVQQSVLPDLESPHEFILLFLAFKNKVITFVSTVMSWSVVSVCVPAKVFSFKHSWSIAVTHGDRVGEDLAIFHVRFWTDLEFGLKHSLLEHFFGVGDLLLEISAVVFGESRKE